MATDIVQRADVWMVQRGDGAGLALEAFSQCGVIADMRWEDFDRDGSIEAGILRLVDFTHSACTQRGLDFIRSEASTGTEAHLLLQKRCEL